MMKEIIFKNKQTKQNQNNNQTNKPQKPKPKQYPPLPHKKTSTHKKTHMAEEILL